MKTKMLKFYDVTYMVPEVFDFLERPIDNYPTFWGAGKGIGDKVVPEIIGGVRCSHIWQIHDRSWTECEAIKRCFIKSNAMFGYNLFVYLMTCKGNWVVKAWRLTKSSFYVFMVYTAGWKIFKKLKKI